MTIKFMTWLPQYKLLKCLSNNNSVLLKKLSIGENQAKTTIIEMLVESQNKLRNDQKSKEKFEVVKHRKYCKPRNLENEPVNCQNRYETLYTDGNDEESENSSYSYTSSSEETSGNTPKQVRSRLRKMKRLKNKSTITVDQEANINLAKPISNQWYQPRQDSNINHYISQSPVETV